MTNTQTGLTVIGVSLTAGYLISKKYKKFGFLGASALVAVGIYGILLYADHYAWNKAIASKDV